MKKLKEPAPFQSTHKLEFLACPWPRDPEWTMFKVGTCHGLFAATDHAYAILSLYNDQQGNGHFGDTMEWFENSCRRDGKGLRIMEVWNDRLYVHLIKKRGFIAQEKYNVIKHFK